MAVELRPTAQAQAFLPQEMTLQVVYEDEHLIVIDKPAGLVVHPAAMGPPHELVWMESLHQAWQYSVFVPQHQALCKRTVREQAFARTSESA